MIHNESIVITYCDADNPDLSPYNAFDLGDAQNLRDTHCVMSRIHNVCVQVGEFIEGWLWNAF